MFERNPDKSIDVTADGAVALVDDFATAGEQEEISTPPMSDKRGYGNLSEGVGECRPERSAARRGVEGSCAASAESASDSEPMAASDVAFLAPELVSEAEDPVPVPAPAEGRLGYRFVKRVFDIAFSLCATIVGLIPIALLCVAIGLESPGSPIYLQKRVGYQGRPLRIFKLRTMVADSDDVEKHLDPKQLERWRRERKVDDDPRVTKVGHFLRKTSLDELPQFLNVLAGQIPLRIIKTGQGEPCEISGLFALPAKELRTQKALFPQVKVASGTCLRTVQNFFSNHTAQRAQTQRILTKRKFTHISWGGASVALPSASRGCLAMAPHLGW